MQETNDQWSCKKIEFKDSGVIEFFRKNLCPSIEPGNNDYPWLVYLTFHYSPKDLTGLPGEVDADNLFTIESEELSILENDSLSVHVASVLKNGVKDFLFYTRNPDVFLKTAEYFRDSYPELSVECVIHKDESWDQYHDFP